MSLEKEKTISGLVWSSLEQVSTQGITLLVGIALARLLSPVEFGLMGMISVFIGISEVFVQSGFNQALIRKVDCSEEDYATVFYFNLAVSILIYIGLFIAAPLISQFFEEPVLTNMVRILGLMIIINAFTIVQVTKLTKNVDFKKLTNITFLSGVISGCIAIGLAFFEFGVWSLVCRQLIAVFVSAVLLWVFGQWKPVAKPSLEALKSLWDFSSKLVYLAIIDIAYNNIYNVIIGKYYPTGDLGQYRQADNFRNLPSKSLASIIDRVSFPILSNIRSQSNYSSVIIRLLKSTMLISFVSLIGLASISEDIIDILLGSQWHLAGEYLKILCFAALFFPMDKLLNTILKVEGRSDLVLKQGLIRKALAIPVVFIAIFIGIKQMLYALVIHQAISMMLLINYSAPFSKVRFKHIVGELYRSFLVCFAVFYLLFYLQIVLNIEPLFAVFIKVTVGTIILVVTFELLRVDEYLYLRKEIVHRFKMK